MTEDLGDAPAPAYSPSPCDLVFVEGGSWISAGIQAISADIGEEALWPSHVAVVVDGLGSLVEANAHGVEKTNLYTRYASTRTAIYRPLNLPNSDQHRILNYLYSSVGQRYSYITLAQHLLVRLFRSKSWADTLAAIDLPNQVCSELAAKAFLHAGRDFGVPGARTTAPTGKSWPAPGFRIHTRPHLIQPDDMLRFCLSHPDKYAQAFDGLLTRRER